MDLRGYVPQRAGCAFELGQLARRRQAARVVLLVDDSTDAAHLDTQLAAAGTAPIHVALPLRDRRAFDAAFAALLRAAGRHYSATIGPVREGALVYRVKFYKGDCLQRPTNRRHREPEEMDLFTRSFCYAEKISALPPGRHWSGDVHQVAAECP